MKQETRVRETDCRDVSATEFKKSFGETLEQVFRGGRVRVTRHGRTAERVVILREADLAKLEGRADAPLDALRAEFDRRVARMQTPAARKAVAKVGTATMKEIGKAALKGSKAGG